MLSKATKLTTADDAARQVGLTLLLFEIQSPINIGMILRVAETYRVRVAIYGSDQILADKQKMQTVSDFSCGALQRCSFDKINTTADICERPRR